MIRKRPISLELKVGILGVCYYGVLDVDVGFVNIRSLMSECIPVQYLSYTEFTLRNIYPFRHLPEMVQ